MNCKNINFCKQVAKLKIIVHEKVEGVFICCNIALSY